MAKIKRTNLTKVDMKHLPKINGDEFKEKCAYYTELVFTKMDKTTAFKEAFPDRYREIFNEVGYHNGSMLDMMIGKEIAKIERSKFVQECFYTANKHWWMKFLGKKQDIYEKLYDTAMDDEESTQNRLSASKIFLQFIPDAPKEDKLVVEVKVGSDEFKDMLAEKKRMLYQAANGNDDIIDGEIDE